ncbi:hypothetical protein KJK32_28205 [Streptomyces sp. JCM17656]|nr:hypothetical protein KJK32_28205 [Streptomyces sp. JCM17656]
MFAGVVRAVSAASPAAPSVTPVTVSVTPETTPSTVSVTPPRRPGASAVSVASVVLSGTERAEAGSSSALATVEPSAQAPVTPAAMTIERRMFLFMLASDP